MNMTLLSGFCLYPGLYGELCHRRRVAVKNGHLGKKDVPYDLNLMHLTRCPGVDAQHTRVVKSSVTLIPSTPALTVAPRRLGAVQDLSALRRFVVANGTSQRLLRHVCRAHYRHEQFHSPRSDSSHIASRRLFYVPSKRERIERFRNKDLTPKVQGRI
jgi:hypothetical protein